MSIDYMLSALDKLILWFEKQHKENYVVILTNVKNVLGYRVKRAASNKNSMLDTTYRCPSCDKILASLGKTEYDIQGWGFVDFCPHCGQAIEWKGIKE